MKKKPMKKDPKYVTMSVFRKHEDFMAKSFAKVFEKLDQHSKILDQHSKILDQHSKVLEIVLQEVHKTNQEAKDHRMMMSSLNHADVSQQRKIEGLELRIEKLEQKVNK